MPTNSKKVKEEENNQIRIKIIITIFLVVKKKKKCIQVEFLFCTKMNMILLCSYIIYLNDDFLLYQKPPKYLRL